MATWIEVHEEVSDRPDGWRNVLQKVTLHQDDGCTEDYVCIGKRRPDGSLQSRGRAMFYDLNDIIALVAKAKKKGW